MVEIHLSYSGFFVIVSVFGSPPQHFPATAQQVLQDRRQKAVFQSPRHQTG